MRVGASVSPSSLLHFCVAFVPPFQSPPPLQRWNSPLPQWRSSFFFVLREQREMVAFVLAVIVDGHRRGQEAVRASAIFALGTLLDMGFDTCRSVGGDEECDDDEKFRAEVSIVKSMLGVASDGSPLVRAEHIGSDNSPVVRDGRVSSSIPLFDDSSHHSDSGILNDGFGNEVVNPKQKGYGKKRKKRILPPRFKFQRGSSAGHIASVHMEPRHKVTLTRGNILHFYASVQN
ncbi:hypothetical protein V8G54_037584 [Vigna mungo]|uniref:Uncharacterized protein n=1 Tax=Vigna mungo TaxID=3915 RepID=A0AAQ3MJM3_VIGMU